MTDSSRRSALHSDEVGMGGKGSSSPMKLGRPGLLVAVLLLSGCAGRVGDVHSPRPLGEDLLSLLPSGQELIVDVDMEQLRLWDPMRDLYGLLPKEGQKRFSQLGFDPLADVDALVLGVMQVGTSSSAVTTVVRGDLPEEALGRGLGEPVNESDYHGVKVFEGPEGMAAARLGSRLFAFGNAVEVRRVVDRSRGDGSSSDKTDKQLQAAFARAPTAKVGRPAARVALVLTDPMRLELKNSELPATEATWVALSLAVGDGFDVGALLGFPGSAEAEEVVRAARRSLKKLDTRPLVRALGLVPILDKVVLLAKESEVHVAWRVAGGLFDDLLHSFASLRDRLTPTGRRSGAPE
jgi:hypothetical protein